MNPRYHLTPSTRFNANALSIGDLSLEGIHRRTRILLTTHLLPQGHLDHPIAHHLPETPMTTTETTTTTLVSHHLVDPHLGDQEASLDVHPRLPTILTHLTTRLEDLHGFRTLDPLVAPELPTILTVTADPLEDRLADLLEDHLEDHPILEDPLTLAAHLLGSCTTLGFRTRIRRHPRRTTNGHHDLQSLRSLIPSTVATLMPSWSSSPSCY